MVYFLRMERGGGGHMPPVYFWNNFEPPFNQICFIGLMGSENKFRKSQKVSARTFEHKGAIIVNLVWGGIYPPPPPTLNSVFYLFEIYFCRSIILYYQLLEEEHILMFLNRSLFSDTFLTSLRPIR
jgi:hypothetical protein